MPTGTPPAIKWSPPSGSPRVITFPDYATDFSSRFIIPFTQPETAGNVVAHYAQGGYDEALVEYLGDWDQAFADEILAWWGHAAAGKLWEFWLEGDNTFSAGLYADAAYSAYILVESFAQPFPIGRELVVHPYTALYDIAKRDAFTADNIYEWPPFSGIWRIDITPQLNFSHAAGELVRSRYGFVSCVTAQEEYPIVEEPGNVMRFSLRLRSQAAIVTP